MRRILSERNLVVLLFVLVFITFVFAQQDTRKMEKAYLGVSTSTISSLASGGTTDTPVQSN